MASIVSVGTAVPPHVLTQETAREMARLHFGGRIPDIAKYLAVFRNALVERRHFVVEADWFARQHTLEEKNRLYLDWASRLSAEAIARCLDGSDGAPDAIDYFIFVSSSGIATPSLDVTLINRFGFGVHTRRIPLFGLGCAGGAAGLALARTLAADDPRTSVLVVAVELNSLTFQPDDFAKSNVVATSLFGDGAAAVLVRGGDDGPIRLVNSATLLRRETDRLMGWDFTDSGFRVVFSRRVPEAIRDMMPEAVDRALAGSGIGTGDVRHLVFHPGGKRILDAYQTVLARPAEHFQASYDVLARYGNMSSATVLFVLDEAIRTGRQEPGDRGLLAAFGPGFSAEVSLLQWV